jgi:hypothetical protein
MKTRDFLFVLLLFMFGFSCEEPNTPDQSCLTMTLAEDFSDALPIQMWLNGKDSFNVGSSPYVQDKCFHLNHKCSSEIRIRFKAGVNAKLALQLLDELGEEVYSQLFDTEDVYIDAEIDNREFNSYFSTGISPWSNGFTAPYSDSDGVAWQWFDGGSEQYLRAIRIAETDERTLTLLASRQDNDIDFPSGEYNISVRIKNDSDLVSGSGDAIGLSILGIRSNGTVELIGTILTVPNDNTWYTRTAVLTATEAFQYIGIVAAQEGGGGDFNIGVSIDTIEIILPETEELYSHTIYDKAITPSDEDLCGGKYKFRIVHEYTNLPFIYEWEELEGDWTFDTDAEIIVPGGETRSLKLDYANKLIPGNYIFNYEIQLTGASIGELTLIFKKAGDVLTSVSSGPLTSGSFTNPLNVTLTDEPDEIIVEFENQGVTSKNLLIDSILILSGPDPLEKAYSDYINFVADLSDILIQYRSFTPFASIPYENDSTYFNLYIPAQFSDKLERSPTTVKTIPLSRKTLATASGLKKQRPFRTVEEGVPAYIVNKLALVFQHAVSGEVVIDGTKWLMEGEIENVDQRPETHPLRQIEVWLTKQDYIKENVI